MDLLTANNFDAYRAGAKWPERLRKDGLIAMTDLDKTMTVGDPLPEGKELSDRRRVRQLMEESGAVTAAVSARTLGLMMSSSALRKAEAKGYTGPEPRWGTDAEGNRVFVPIEKDSFFDDCLGWDMLGSFCEGIMVGQSDGYAVDAYYDELLKYGESEAQRRLRERAAVQSVHNQTLTEQYGKLLEMQQAGPMAWRPGMLQLLIELLPDARHFMHDIEFEEKYEARKTNVSPRNLKGRIQLHFEGEEGLLTLRQLASDLKQKRKEKHPLAKNVNLIDESKIFWGEPQKNKYTVYLAPNPARKENLIRRMFHGAAAGANRAFSSLKSVYADDAITGLRVVNLVDYFLVPARSLLERFIVERQSHYGFHSLEFLWNNDVRREDRLRPVKGEEGLYEYYRPGKKPTVVVLGGKRYGEDETPPGSFAKFLQEFVVNGRAG